MYYDRPSQVYQHNFYQQSPQRKSSRFMNFNFQENDLKQQQNANEHNPNLYQQQKQYHSYQGFSRNQQSQVPLMKQQPVHAYIAQNIPTQQKSFQLRSTLNQQKPIERRVVYSKNFKDSCNFYSDKKVNSNNSHILQQQKPTSHLQVSNLQQNFSSCPNQNIQNETTTNNLFQNQISKNHKYLTNKNNAYIDYNIQQQNKKKTLEQEGKQRDSQQPYKRGLLGSLKKSYSAVDLSNIEPQTPRKKARRICIDNTIDLKKSLQNFDFRNQDVVKIHNKNKSQVQMMEDFDNNQIFLSNIENPFISQKELKQKGKQPSLSHSSIGKPRSRKKSILRNRNEKNKSRKKVTINENRNEKHLVEKYLRPEVRTYRRSANPFYDYF